MNNEQIKQEAKRIYPDGFGLPVIKREAFEDGANYVLSTLQVPEWVDVETENPTEPDLYHVKISNGQETWDDVQNYTLGCWEVDDEGDEVVSWLKLRGQPLLPLIEAQKKIEELEREVVSLKDEIFKLK